MSTPLLHKPFKHFETFSMFYVAKVSVNADNTSYTSLGVTSEGTPDILWGDLVFIDDIAKIWNRGRFYAGSLADRKLATTAQRLSASWDKAVITLVDKSITNSLVANASVFDDYPGIIPSIVLYGDDDRKSVADILSLVSRGCDVIASSTSTEPSTLDGLQAKITGTVIKNEEAGFISNCWLWNTTSPSDDQCSWASLYQEYGIKIDNNWNTRHSDNMRLSAKLCASQADVDNYLADATTEQGWAIVVIDSSTMSALAITSIKEVIADYVENGQASEYGAVYLQMNEAIKAFAPEFNITHSADLPFRVYKDGKVDADLSQESIDKFKDQIGAQSDWNEDDPDSLAYILNKPESLSNVRSDWNVNDPSSEAYILNKPEIPDISGLATTAYVVSEDNRHEEEIMFYTTSELDKKVDKVDGKGLSTNDYTTDEKNKLAGIASGAEVNVQSDWNATSGDAFIKNKPDLSAFVKTSSDDGEAAMTSNIYLPLLGGTMSGTLVAAPTSPSISAARNIIISTIEPTAADGNNGDIWIIYDEA